MLLAEVAGDADKNVEDVQILRCAGAFLSTSVGTMFCNVARLVSKSERDLPPTRNPPSASTSHIWPAELRTTYHTRTSQIISCF